jgi:hypothetical protein
MIIINTSQHNGTQKGVNIFYASPILSGQYIGKFATNENALNEFPEIFEQEPYEVADLDPKAFEIDTTPPPLYGLGVVIPDQFIWVFPDNKFILEGFEIPLTNGAVDIAYFEWQAFRSCLNNGNHEDLKRALKPLWEYVELQIKEKNLVQLSENVEASSESDFKWYNPFSWFG